MSYKAESIHERSKAISRKAKIVKEVYCEKHGEFYGGVLGKLNKGKVHCSCPMCSFDSREGSISDKKKKDAINQQIKDYE